MVASGRHEFRYDLAAVGHKQGLARTDPSKVFAQTVLEFTDSNRSHDS